MFVGAGFMQAPPTARSDEGRAVAGSFPVARPEIAGRLLVADRML